MTPAERASAVVFALRNCTLEAMAPGEAVTCAAAAYERGLKPATHLIDMADEQTAMRLRAATDPTGKDRLAAGNLDDYAMDRADAVFACTMLSAERRWNPSSGLDELAAIHKGLFEGVSEDAGKLCTSSTAREVTNDQAQVANLETFFPVGFIGADAYNIATELADERNLYALDRDVFAHTFASIYDKLGYLHPLRGGNTIALRIFGSYLARDVGWNLDWGSVTHEEYRPAEHSAYRGDASVLKMMFDVILCPANPTRVLLVASWNRGPAH